MNIALIGSGGREHALCEKIFLSKKLRRIYCIPGNAGTSRIAQNVDLDLNKFSKLYKFLKSKILKYFFFTILLNSNDLNSSHSV